MVIREFCTVPPNGHSRPLSLGASRKTRTAYKNRISAAAWFMVVLLNWFAAIDVAATQTANELEGRTLMEALRKGGYNIYFRHAATDWSQND